MTIARYMGQTLQRASWIRRMFETGAELKARLGADQVFDFSLGNPLLEPPPAFTAALRELVAGPPSGLHRYMPNNGFPSTRQAVAAQVSQEQGVAVTAEDVVMTVGAAGALNVALRAVLDPGDEVIILAPYFVEYMFYVEFGHAVPRIVETAPTFDLDLAAIERAISEQTKAIILNTPNNPTGRVYPPAALAELAAILKRAEKQHGHEIYLVVDTPYAKLTYGEVTNPPLFADHPSTLIAHSYSKELGLAGERIGYLAISPHAPHREALRAACTFANRALGFVNAPALMQRALEACLAETIDVGHYARLRGQLVGGLQAAGYTLTVPDGAFYVFPGTPLADDVAFTELLLDEQVLVVPGSGFGRAGHMRIAYCVDEATLTQALPRFARARERALKQSGS